MEYVQLPLDLYQLMVEAFKEKYNIPSGKKEVWIGSVPRDKKIYAIKAVRETAGVGLKDAKEFVERIIDTGYPGKLGSFAIDEAYRVRDRFREIGCFVTIGE